MYFRDNVYNISVLVVNQVEKRGRSQVQFRLQVAVFKGTATRGQLENFNDTRSFVVVFTVIAKKLL